MDFCSKYHAELKQNVFEIWNMELILDMKGMLANLFDRLYVVTGIEIPKYQI